MYKKKISFLLLATIISLSMFTSCEKEPQQENIPIKTSGVYVLNAGKFKNNNSSMSYYDVESSKVVSTIFLDKNGRGLGDTGQDMLVYGSKLYVSVYKSGLIEVVEPKTAKSIKTIKMINGQGEQRSPRTLTAFNGKVYVVLYEGYVVAIDTLTFGLSPELQVGPNPDGSVIANNKLYVANSGGMQEVKDSTVSVVDLAQFKEIKKITVNMNPQVLKADSKGNIYVVSQGNYKDIAGKFQKISNDDVIVSDIDIKGVKNFDVVKDKAYISTYDYDDSWQAVNKKIMVYDMMSNKLISENIVNTEIEKTPYSLDVNPITNEIYLGVTDYVNNGKIYCFQEDGSLKYTFEVGLNPCKTVWLY
ncbi:MAG: hypothetical protein CSA89_00325 [Bacteroidales bacterium]|nr:MAG: hypothetical protein CSA89_00325 [Bacteroidales bacterium]